MHKRPTDTDYRTAADNMVLAVTSKVHANRNQRVQNGRGGKWVEMWVWVPDHMAEFARVARRDKSDDNTT